MAGEEHVASPAQMLDVRAGFLVLQSSAGNELDLFDTTDPAHPALAGGGKLNTCYGLNLGGADGNRQTGLWVPASWYGVSLVPVKQP